MKMSKYEQIRTLGQSQFRRLTSVKKQTFETMVEILRKAHAEKKKRGGRPNKLCIEDMLLLALEYLREYRTYFHIGQSYGISESNVFQTARWVEDTLIKGGSFALPGSMRSTPECGQNKHHFAFVFIELRDISRGHVIQGLALH